MLRYFDPVDMLATGTADRSILGYIYSTGDGSGSPGTQVKAISSFSGTNPNMQGRGINALWHKFTGSNSNLSYPECSGRSFQMSGDTLFFSVCIYVIVMAPNGGQLFTFADIVDHVQAYMSSAGAITFRKQNSATTRDNNHTNLTGTTLSLQGGRWVTIAGKIIIHASTGEVHIRLDGASSDNFSVTGVDTNKSASGKLSVMEFGTNGNSAPSGRDDIHQVMIRDVLIWDTVDNGDGFTDWQNGDTYLEFRKPIDDGPVIQGTAVGSGTENWERVDDAAPDYATSYVRLDAANEYDVYVHEDSGGPNSAPCKAIVAMIGQKEGGGQGVVRGKIRNAGGTEETGSNVNAPAGWGSFGSVINKKPGGAAGSLTIQDVNDCTIGPQLVTP